MLRTHLLIATLIIGIIASSALSVPQVHAASGIYFDNVVIIAMENQNYVDVMGTGTGSPNAPFIATILNSGHSATYPNYHSYGSGPGLPSISGCSAACYVAFVAGGTQGVSDGYCCITHPTLTDSLQTAGLTWQAFCESGCPRGPDHFPFVDASGAYTANTFTTGSVSTTDFINAANSATPPNFLWFTPTDSHNMHDNSVQAGDAYLQSFLVGTGSVATPGSGSLLASKLFQSGHRTLLMLWWDEYDPSPQLFYSPTILTSSSIDNGDSYMEYSWLHLIETNWALPTLTANDAAAVLPSVFSSPGPLATSFIFSPSTPIVNLAVTFTAATTGGKSPYTISWSFGDGATGTGATATHVYSGVQSYTVTETAIDSSSPSKTATASKTITVTTPPPLATSFTFLPSTPVINSIVTFTSTTTWGTAPYTVSWNFGDGTTGAGATATHTYTIARSFTVAENATDSSTPPKTATSSQSIIIYTILPLSIATFQASSSSPQVAETVTFTSLATGGISPYTYTITFGDGASGTGSSTTHAYSVAGSYTADLTVTDSASPQASASLQLTISVLGNPPTLTIPANQTVVAGRWINFTIIAASVNIGGAVALSATGLPPGASFDQTTGIFSWKPGVSQVGSYIIVFTTTDSSDPSAPTSKSMEIQVSQAAPGGSSGGNGGSGGSSNGGCLFCGLIPRISGTVGLFVVGGLLGIVATLALLTVKARASLEQTRRRVRRLSGED